MDEIIFEKEIPSVFQNLKIYGSVGEKNFFNIFSKSINFWSQFDLGSSEKDVLSAMNLFQNEYVSKEEKVYGLLIEYELRNCSEWEYFKKDVIKNKT